MKTPKPRKKELKLDGEVTYEVFCAAGINWDVYHELKGKEANFPTWKGGFSGFMGFDVHQSRYGKTHHMVLVPRDTVHKFNWLAGPHYRALLKAYYINQKEKGHAKTR